MTGPLTREEKRARAKAQRLIDEGWEQTSRKYRAVARLPAGKTGLQALLEVDPLRVLRLLENAEMWAADEFRRVHSHEENGMRQELTNVEFHAFRAAGGKVSR